MFDPILDSAHELRSFAVRGRAHRWPHAHGHDARKFQERITRPVISRIVCDRQYGSVCFEREPCAARVVNTGLARYTARAFREDDDAEALRKARTPLLDHLT